MSSRCSIIKDPKTSGTEACDLFRKCEKLGKDSLLGGKKKQNKTRGPFQKFM